MKIQHFKDLIAWQEANKLAVLIYKETKSFPKEEVFGLINQLRRAAVSISSNIAEGFSRGTYKEKGQFFSIARGSLSEVESQLHLSKEIGYLSNSSHSKLENQLIIVSKLLTGIIQKTRSFTY